MLPHARCRHRAGEGIKDEHRQTFAFPESPRGCRDRVLYKPSTRQLTLLLICTSTSITSTLILHTAFIPRLTMSDTASTTSDVTVTQHDRAEREKRPAPATSIADATPVSLKRSQYEDLKWDLSSLYDQVRKESNNWKAWKDWNTSSMGPRPAGKLDACLSSHIASELALVDALKRLDRYHLLGTVSDGTTYEDRVSWAKEMMQTIPSKSDKIDRIAKLYGQVASRIPRESLETDLTLLMKSLASEELYVRVTRNTLKEMMARSQVMYRRLDDTKDASHGDANDLLRLGVRSWAMTILLPTDGTLMAFQEHEQETLELWNKHLDRLRRGQEEQLPEQTVEYGAQPVDETSQSGEGEKSNDESRCTVM